MTIDGDKYRVCSNEQTFKMKYIKEVLSKKGDTVFCIETEETIKGFPDVLCIEKTSGRAYFFEFKYAKSGRIKFQPTQPSFYKAHPELIIQVVAYDNKKDFVHVFNVRSLFDKESQYKMNEIGEVCL